MVGEILSAAARLALIGHADATPAGEPSWCLQGVSSHERYVTRDEKIARVVSQAVIWPALSLSIS